MSVQSRITLFRRRAIPAPVAVPNQADPQQWDPNRWPSSHDEWLAYEAHEAHLRARVEQLTAQVDALRRSEAAWRQRAVTAETALQQQRTA